MQLKLNSSCKLLQRVIFCVVELVSVRPCSVVNGVEVAEVRDR